MKKIVLLSDGTGNSPSNPFKTNVWRLYQALDRSDPTRQIAFYDNGVGTSAFRLTALLGLAFGLGLARNVRQSYGFLCRVYEPGDEIYGFGFSRGAFTIRVVIAMIASQGIIDRNRARDEDDLDRLVRAAYDRFRQEGFDPSLLSFFLRPLRDWLRQGWNRLRGREQYDPSRNIRYSDPDGAPHLINFVGVWDTVDAYGLPVDELTRAWDRVIWPLSAKDRDLSPRVARARHALALDEQRESFEPMLWNEADAPVYDTRLKQVWFAGVHSNVGGSYPNDSLAHVSLDWMMRECDGDDGLAFLPDRRRDISQTADINGPIYDSRGGMGNVYRYAPRDLDVLCNEEKPGIAAWIKATLSSAQVNRNEVKVEKPKIHHSVFDRIVSGGDAYAPINLPERYVIVAEDGSLREVPTEVSAGYLAPETREQARVRRERQTFAWNKVWRRKIIYYLTLLCVIGFIVYPYSGLPNNGNDWVAPWIEPLIGTLNHVVQALPGLIGKIPGFGFAAGWAQEYEAHPFVFATILLVIAVLLVLSYSARASIRREMRQIWQHVSQSGAPPRDASSRRRWLAAFLAGPAYNWGVRRPLRFLLEASAVVLLLALLVAAASTLVFTGVSGLGGVCRDSQIADVVTARSTFRFEPGNPCLPTGLVLLRDAQYRVKFVISEDWSDATVDADVSGWRDAPWYLHLALPLRRHLFAGWYKPVARIDDTLFDIYVLEDATPLPASADRRPRTVLEADLTARQSGELFLYLNDAVLFGPGWLHDFYKNNRGFACVTVVPVETRDPLAQMKPTLRETVWLPRDGDCVEEPIPDAAG